MTPQPSCSEIARAIVGKHLDSGLIEYTDDDGTQMIADITEALQAKQKTIEELQAKLESCEMLSGSTMGRICCQYHRAEALEKELESLRAEVEALKKEIGNREV